MFPDFEVIHRIQMRSFEPPEDQPEPEPEAPMDAYKRHVERESDEKN